MRYLTFFIFILLPIFSHATVTRFEEGLEAYQNNNYRQAFDILLPLAQAGNVDAQLSVGTMYNKGQGVKQDTKKALKFYQLAADQGDYIAKTLIQTLLLTNSEFKYYNDQDTIKTNYDAKNIRIPVHSISNSILFIAVFIILLLVGFALFHVFKPKKPIRKMPVFDSDIKENKIDEEITEIAIFEETPILEEIPAAYFESAQTIHETPIVEKVFEDEIVIKEKLFEYCYNNYVYDEKKSNKKSITTIQRRRYQGSVLEYCYEECYEECYH
jgi:hypothetical protein